MMRFPVIVCTWLTTQNLCGQLASVGLTHPCRELVYTAPKTTPKVCNKQFLNQAHTGHRPACTWFLEIDCVHNMCVCVCLCVCVCSSEANNN